MTILNLAIFVADNQTGRIWKAGETCLNDIEAKDFYLQFPTFHPEAVCYDDVEPLKDLNVVKFVKTHFKKDDKTKTGYFLLPGFSDDIIQFYLDMIKENSNKEGRLQIIKNSVDYLKLSPDEKENVLSDDICERYDEEDALKSIKLLAYVDGMIKFHQSGYDEHLLPFGFVYDDTNSVKY